MAELEIFFEIEGSQYGEGIMLEEYHDRISLVSANKGKEGTNYKKWCFPQTKDRVPAEKAIPWKISLGPNRKSAVDMLRKIAMELKE